MEKILINILIGLIVIVGFFIYWGRASGWFKEGGLVYEWWKTKKESLKKSTKDNNDDDNNNNNNNI